jgi:hypothetical protein
MAKANQEKKRKIFKLFSQNLEWIKEHPSIEFKPDFSNGYICPLCFNVFFEKDLDNTLKNYLTLEDIPPKSLGGKPLTLTCKSCNSVCGHNLDVHLLNKLLDLDSRGFLPNSKTKVTLELNGNKVNGQIEIASDGGMEIDIQTKNSNPIEANQFIEDLNPLKETKKKISYLDKIFENQFQSPTFNVKFQRIADERKVEVALLRIAYLIAYSTFGNGFYLNSGLYKVREQILNPSKEILPKVFWIDYEFPKEMEGINIITSPKELQCFLIIFSLKTKSKVRQFAIVLPGPSTPGIKVYDHILKKLYTSGNSGLVNFIAEKIKEEEYLKSKKFAFASNWYWEHFTRQRQKNIN